MHQEKEVPDLLFVITAVAALPCTQYREWHFMGPEQTPTGEVRQIQELGRVRARKAGDRKVEVATCAFLQTVDPSFSANIEAAVEALLTILGDTGSAWEAVYVGEF